jgi:uncharacterized membrane protein
VKGAFSCRGVLVVGVVQGLSKAEAGEFAVLGVTQGLFVQCLYKVLTNIRQTLNNVAKG